MTRSSIISFIAAVLLIAAVYADFDKSVQGYRINLLETGNNRLSFTIELTDYKPEEYSAGEENYTRLSLPGAGLGLTKGTPRLPVISKPFILPKGSTAHVKIKDIETREIDDILIEPCHAEFENRLNSSTTPVFDDDIYSKDEYYPSDIVTISDPVTAGEIRLAAVNFAPFRFNPVQRKLQIVHKIEVEIEFSGGFSPDDFHIAKSRRNNPYLSDLLNASQIEFTDDPADIGAYLFIIPNQNYADEIERLVDWKFEQGYEVTIADLSETGSTAEEIKDYIQEAYNTWEIPPQYVILIGDIDGDAAVPCFYYNCGNGEMSPSDHGYSLLEGEDYFSDIQIGRLSIRDEDELSALVYKILRYEMKPYTGMAGWFQRGLMLADQYALSAVNVKQWARNSMMEWGYIEVDTVYYPASMPTFLVQNMINGGVGLINHRGLIGWGGWSNANIQALQNNSMNPIVLGCTSGTNDFETTECLGEAWLRAGEYGAPKGGSACIGPSSQNTYSYWDGTIDQGLIWAVYHDSLYHLGDIVDRGKFELWLNFPWNRGPGGTGNSVECYYHIYELLGDPGMAVWTDSPQNITARHQRRIPLGMNFLEIAAEDENGTLTDAKVSLTSGEAILNAGYTDENGYINLPVQMDSTGEIKVTITKRNHAHYQGVVEVFAQLYITLDTVVVEDDSLPPSQGNGNGIPNPGETIELQITMTNPSTIFASGVRVSISSPDTLIQILEDEQYYGLIGPGQSVTSTEPFVLEISLAAEHGSEIIITLDAGDNLGLHYISQYILEITAPSPQFDNYSLPQAAVDSALYPGESSDMIIELMNTGGETSEITAVLYSETEGVTITDSTAVFPAAVAGEAFANNIDPFHLSVDTELYPGITAPLTMTIELADGWLDTLFFQLQIGPPQVNDPVVPVEGCWYYCFDNNDVGFNQAPSFQWIEIDPDSGGTGITLNLQDGQPNQSDSEILPLPAELNFQYCGQSIDNITVGSDGWIACGETGFSDFRNRPLPAANEPDGMIAVFWDDLMLIDGGEVYYAYIDYLDCFVVEWSRLKHPQSSVLRQTFQLILWDAETYPTNTGDSPLKFQYYDVNDIGTQSNWSTTGLLSLTAENGLQYVYSTFYTPGAKVLTDGLALYFTTDPGSRIIPPILTYSPNSFRFELSSGQNETGVLILSNLGEAVLNYDLEIMPWQTEASGGPDNFGNIWIDSDEPGGMEFGWVNIGSIGVEIEFPHNDSTSADLPLGFSFPFYNRSFSTVIVSANGWLSFTSHSNAWNNTQLPSTSAPENLIAGWWDDLDPLTGDGRVLIWNNGSDSTVVSFLEVDHYGTSVQGTYTFQYILQREGRITLQYYEMEGNVSSATIGIQNQQKNDGLTIAHNNNYVHNLLRIDIVRPWLSLSPISGSMEENEIDTILVTASAANMYPTIYNTNIFLYSNDPEQQLVILPVEMEVTGQTLGGIADDLRIIRQEDGYLLKWLKREGYEYRIYSSSQAHFEPENAVLLGITEEDSFLDVSVNDQMRFYKVVAVMK